MVVVGEQSSRETQDRKLHKVALLSCLPCIPVRSHVQHSALGGWYQETLLAREWVVICFFRETTGSGPERRYLRTETSLTF